MTTERTDRRRTQTRQQEEREALREIVDAILRGRIRTKGDLEYGKKEAASRLHLSDLPGNADILSLASPEERGALKLLVKKPTRTLSGVAVVAVMTSPARCPHGICLPCPGGVPHRMDEWEIERPSPQSYTGREPAALRAADHCFDPYDQVAARLAQLYEIGHPVDKAELIIMGGTMTARPAGYQYWFVKRCLEAMNDFSVEGHAHADLLTMKRISWSVPPKNWRSFEDVARDNESAMVRNVGITFETRPDWCGDAEVQRMLSLGATKVELGVQSLNDDLLLAIRRGHSIAEVIQANRVLREAGLKVGFHMMPGLPGSTPERDLEGFLDLFRRDDLQPDYLKIYPTLVVKGTELYEMWKRGEYTPLNDEDAIELISRAKAVLPRYVRLQRVQRDIPAYLIEAGVKKSNLRQLARKQLEARGGRCKCIRCREAGLRGISTGSVELRRERYEACGGIEHFLSCDTVDDTLVGFLRLRLGDRARVRELHVYGPMVPIGRSGGWQHRGYGARLLAAAEETATIEGYDEISVTSGIGVRGYYASLGYTLRGHYMVKGLGGGNHNG